MIEIVAAMVLIVRCHVVLKFDKGPNAAHVQMIRNAKKQAAGCADLFESHLANEEIKPIANS